MRTDPASLILWLIFLVVVVVLFVILLRALGLAL